MKILHESTKKGSYRTLPFLYASTSNNILFLED